jgi:hypothetical protein
MSQKKVDVSATELRRSTHTKPNGKLQTYSDIQNAKFPSSSDESSDSDQPSSSEELPSNEQLSSREDGSDTSSDQGASNQAGLAYASSSPGSEDQSEADDDQDTPAPAVERNGDKIWEILDGDERTPLAVGIKAPNRLRLRVHNRDTEEIREFNYKEGDPDTIRSIDWDNRAHVKDIAKWRNQIFNRLKFPVRKTTRWANEEVSFLTLVYEKFALAVAQTKRISLPNRDAVVQIFMEVFGDVHDRDHVSQRIRRKNGSRLAKLQQRLEGDLKPEGGPEYQLTIARGELNAYMEGDHVRLAFDLAEYERVKEARPEIEKAAKTRKTVDRKQNKFSSKPTAKRAKTGRIAKTRKTRQTTRVVESDEKEPSESDEGEPVESDQGEPGDRLLHRRRNLWSLDLDDAKPGGHDAAPEWRHRHSILVSEDSDIRNDPSRAIHDAEDREEAQKKLLEAREKWLATVMGPSAATETSIDPAQSSHHPQQPDVQTDEREASPETGDWLEQAFAGMHDRFERFEGEVHFAHEYREYHDRNVERQTWYVDHDEETGQRFKEAPAVNSLLNSAIVPPIGYHGDVRTLVRDRALPEDQLRLHELNQSALEAYHAAHDKEYANNEEVTED